MFDLQWADELDEQQLAAASHGAGPLVVVAGAGTGKTHTLTGRVEHLLRSGVAPERVLLLTFTRRAAEEMISRVAAACADSADRGAARRVWGGTFHAIAHRLVSEHAGALGLAQMSVLDPADVVDLVDMLRDDHGLDPSQTVARIPRASTIAALYSRAVNTGRAAREVITLDFPWVEPHTDAVLALLRAYMARKRERGLLDFDDLLLSWRALLDDPVVGARMRRRWDYVLVDEYQDVNSIQVDIVTRLRPDGDGLTVVGDDAQALYSFRGAGSGQLADLLSALPSASLVKLERNYRSRQPLLDLANVVRPGTGPGRVQLVASRVSVGRAARPRLVRCDDPADEARQLVAAVLSAVDDGGRLRDHAVLMRAAAHSDVLELELTARKVPFVKYGGLKFLETAHVKDFLSAARVLLNPRDEVAWFRVLRLHAGVGAARARRMVELLLADPHDANGVVALAPPSARLDLAGTLDVLAAGRRRTDAPGQSQACLRSVRPLVESRYRDVAARLADLDRLAEVAAQSTDLGAFVADVTLDPPASTSDYAKPPHLDEDYLTLSTVHSAKGLEWPTVHLIHAVDGAFPSDMALAAVDGLEEEQRVFYVAVTRARDQLHVYTPLRMPHHRRARDDRHSYAPQSRFLTDEAVAVMDVVAPARPRLARTEVPAASRVAVPALDGLFE